MIKYFKRRSKLPYLQEEVAVQIGQIADLYKQREKSMQLAVVHSRSDTKQQRYLEEVDLIDDNINTAQKALGFMLRKNEKQAKHEVDAGD